MVPVREQKLKFCETTKRMKLPATVKEEKK